MTSTPTDGDIALDHESATKILNIIPEYVSLILNRGTRTTTAACLDEQNMNKLSNGLRIGLAYINEHINGFQPINRFPPEVLSMIFLELKVHYTYCDKPPECVQHYECLRIFSVCRYWRTVALGCSELWTCVYLSPNTIDIAKLFCERSAQRLLSLVVCRLDKSESSIRMWDVIKASSERIKKLAVTYSHISKWPGVMEFPAMTTFIDHDSYLGLQRVPGNQQDLKLISLQHASFRFIPTRSVGFRLPPNLTSLHLNLSTSRIPDPPDIFPIGSITNILDTQRNLQELILEGVPLLSPVDPETVYPRTLENLKRLAFYRSLPTSIGSILSYIKPSPTMSIAVDMSNRWGPDIERVDPIQFFARAIPSTYPGFTSLHLHVDPSQKMISIPNQPSMMCRHSYKLIFILTGHGGNYKFTATVRPETKDKILTCLASSGKLDSLQTMLCLSPPNTFIPHFYHWLPSASQLTTLTLFWDSALWAQPKSISNLFSVLPPTLAELIMQVDYYSDNNVAPSNFEDLVTLNNGRNRPIKITLCLQVHPKRYEELLVKFPYLNQSNHVQALLWLDMQAWMMTTGEKPRGTGIDTTLHNYWPTWMNTYEAEQCRMARDGAAKK